jgi:hypothetical protein
MATCGGAGGDLAGDEVAVLRAVFGVDDNDVECGPPINVPPETIPVRRGETARLESSAYRQALRSAVERSMSPLSLDQVFDDEASCFTFSNAGVILDQNGLPEARSHSVSRPGFDRSGTHAIVFISWACGPDCGYVGLDLYQKDQGRWSQLDEVRLIEF